MNLRRSEPGSGQPVEERLRAAMVAGRSVDLSSADGRTGGADGDASSLAPAAVPAEVIRHLLTVPPAPGESRRPLHIIGAEVEGDLDLSFLRAERGVILRSCHLQDISLHSARVPVVELGSSTFGQLFGVGFETEGYLDLTAVRCRRVGLVHSRVGNSVVLSSATLTGENGFGLQLTGSTVAGSLFLDEGFRTQGCCVDLEGAHITGDVRGQGELVGEKGYPALTAAGTVIDGSVLCGGGFSADGELDFRLARIGGQVNLVGSRLSSDDAYLSLHAATIGESVLLLPESVRGDLRLSRARCQRYVDDVETWRGRIYLHGFVYDDIECRSPDVSIGDRVDTWLRLSSDEQEDFRPQPYQQLAAVCRAHGHDAWARRVALAKQRQRRRVQPRRNRLPSLLLDVLVGYGYRSWLAGVWLVLFYLLSVVAFARLYPSSFDSAADAGRFSSWAFAADQLLPVLALPQTAAFSAQGWALVLVISCTITGWALASVFALSLTGVIKKD